MRALDYEYELYGYTPRAVEFEVSSGACLGEESGTLGVALTIAIWEGGRRRRVQCIRIPPSWSARWAVVAAWLVVTQKGFKGLKTWLGGEPVVIVPKRRIFPQEGGPEEEGDWPDG